MTVTISNISLASLGFTVKSPGGGENLVSSYDGNVIGYTSVLTYYSGLIPDFLLNPQGMLRSGNYYTDFISNLSASSPEYLYGHFDGCYFISSGTINGYHTGLTISGDGRYVAYNSAAIPDNQPNNNSPNVVITTTIIEDRQTGQTSYAIKNKDGLPLKNDGIAIQLSSDGSYLLFSASSSNIADGFHGKFNALYIEDLKTGKNTPVAVSYLDPSNPCSGVDSNQASMSGDGRYVVFSGTGSDIVANDTNNISDIFLRDTITNTTKRISVSDNGDQAYINPTLLSTDPYTYQSMRPIISADGQHIVYQSGAANLVPGMTDNKSVEIYEYDTNTCKTILISQSIDSTHSTIYCGSAQVSGDGRFVTFLTQPGILTSTEYYKDSGGRDIASGFFIRDTILNKTTALEHRAFNLQHIQRGGDNSSTHLVCIDCI